MKKNANVFIGLVLFAALCGGFVWLMGVNEEDQWQPSGVYDQLHTSSYSASSTSATLSSPASGSGLALSMSPSSTMRHSGASFYAGATPSPTNLPSLQGGAGGRLLSLQGGTGGNAGVIHATSTAEFKSIGGGGNGGASMGSGSMRATSSPPHLLTSSPPHLITSSPISLSPITYSVSQGSMGASADYADAMMADNPVAAMAASANGGLAFSTFSGFSSAEATVGDYVAWGADTYMGMGRSAVRGRQNTSNVDDSWQIWLQNYWLPNNNNTWGTQGEDGNWYITQTDLRAAYDAFCSKWNTTIGPAPTWEAWLAWFDTYGYGDGLALGGSTYFWVPVGDVLPLLLLALLYIAFVAFKSIKPSFKPERSE